MRINIGPGQNPTSPYQLLLNRSRHMFNEGFVIIFYKQDTLVKRKILGTKFAVDI